MTPALISSCQLAMKLFDGGWNVRGVILDISKALDKVWHQLWLLKLNTTKYQETFFFLIGIHSMQG